MKIKTNILLRIYFVYALIFLSAISILVQVYLIQNYKDGYWQKKSKDLSTRLFSIPSERGNIYGYDENLLATSIPYFDLYVDFGAQGMSQELFDANVDSLAWYMANVFQKQSLTKYKSDLIQAKKNKKRYFLIKRGASYPALKAIKQWPLFREGKNKGGLIVETKQNRKNPYNLLAQRTIGVYRENVAPVGLEAYYDNILAGQAGQVLKQKIAGDTWMPINDSLAISPINGLDIYTTIDINLQDAAETSLFKALDSSQADFGCAIVMDVKTGAIRAIANLGRSGDGRLWEIENYAVTFKSEPGSTFKAVSYLMLLDKGYVDINDTVYNGGGVWNFYGRRMSDEHIHDPILSIKEAFARSSNIAIARLIDKHYKKNKNEFYNNLKKYGLTQKSGIDLLGETNPKVTPPKQWSNLSLPWRATGYEQTFSPLQLLTFYNAIANNGYRAKPYLVEKIGKNGKVIKEIKPQIASTPIASQKAIDQLKAMLKEVVENPKGTGKSIRSEYFELGGKSGTAKILDRSAGTFSNANQAMFAGFFPVTNPRYSCIVMIYNPKGAYRTGGGIAGPVFKEIAERALATDINIAPDYTKEISTPPILLAKMKGENHQVKNILDHFGYPTKLADEIDFVETEVRKSGVKLAPSATSESKMPDLIGLSFDDAIYLMESLGLKITYSGIGKVQKQSIAPGTNITRGNHIYIVMN
ncbi:MAG: transpeptidase family protein [Chitinophagales bacterium]|nr:transpeptidase family protein [Chitinophagales bacterium]